MSKLGIAYVLTRAGVGAPVVVNPGDWTRHLIDVRPILKHIPSVYDTPDRFALLMSFVADGTLLTLVRSRGGRAGDNASGWIFIPAKMEISGAEVVSELGKMRGILLGTKPEPAQLARAFPKDYPDFPVALTINPSSSNGVIAMRDFNKYTLEQLVGEERYQSYYDPCQVVILTDDPGSVTDAKDLSDKPLEELVSLTPPTQQEIDRHFSPGATICTADGEPFGRQIIVRKGEKVTFVARKGGFDPIRFTVRATTNGATVLSGERKRFSLTLTPNDFIVTDDHGDPVQDVVITINNRYISPSITVNEDQATPAYVVVKAKGYVRKEGQIDLTAPLPLAVKLRRQERSGRSPFAPGSPRPNRFLVWGSIALGVCAAVFFTLWLCGVFSSKEVTAGGGGEIVPDTSLIDTSTEEWLQNAEDSGGFADQQTTEDMQEGSDVAEFDEAVDYFNRCGGRLSREELARYSFLTGFFDDLNNFNLDRVNNHWSTMLASVRPLEKLFRHSAESRRKGVDPTQGGARPRFNTDPNDGVITLQAYINWIDAECARSTQSSSKSAGGKATSRKKKKVATQKNSGSARDAEENKVKKEKGRGGVGGI